MVDMERQLALTEKISGKGSSAYREQKKAVDNLSKSIKENKKALEDKRKSLSLNEMTMSELRHQIKLLAREQKDLTPNDPRWNTLNRQLKEAKSRLKDLQDQSNKTGNLFKGAWNSATGAVAIVTGAIHVATRALGGLYEKIAGFEQANANLATILGKSVGDINTLTESALELGRTTEYTASQVTLLQTELAKLGFSEDQIKAMEESVLHFATAVGAELPEAAALAGATLRIFDLQAGDAEEVLGALAVATNKSALNFSFLQSAMSIVGPVANTFGMSVKDTTALLGALANAGFDASSAATATRNILLNLANANGKLAKEIGKPVRTFPELIQAMQDLNARGLELNKTLELTDKRSVSAFNRFLAGADSARDLREALEDTGGELGRIADERMNTLEGSVKLLTSAWEGLILQLRKTTGPLKSIVDWATKAVNALSELFEDPEDTMKRQAEGRISGYYKQMVKLDRSDPERFKQDAMAIVQTADDAYTQALAEYRKKNSRKNRKLLDEAINDKNAAMTAYLKVLEEPVSLTGNPVIGNTDDTPDNPPTKPTQAWSLNNDRNYLEAKAELMRQYNDGEIKSQGEFNERLYELEVSSLTARLSLNKEKGLERTILEGQLQEKIMRHKTEQQKKEASQEKEAEQARRKALNANISQMQRAHDIERGQLENFWLERIAQTEKGSQEEIELRKQMNEELGRLDLDYLESLRALLEQVTSSGEFLGIAIPTEQIDVLKKKLQDVIKQILSAQSALREENTDNDPNVGHGELFGVSQAQWNQLFENIAKGKLSIEDLGNAFTAMGGVAQEGFNLASQAIAMTNAKEQQELKDYQKANTAKQKALQKRLSAGLMTQAQYDAEIEKMEAEQEAKEEEIALRQAEREKRMSIAQAIIQTALSTMKTFTQFGGWPAGVAPAAIMGAIGAAQVALIASTPVTGREEGGAFGQDGPTVRVRRRQDGRSFPARLSPDRRGYIDRPTVLVGENGAEYVIPNEALQNPSVAPFVDAIETARRNGTLRNLNLAAVQPRLAVTGRASGGTIADVAMDGGSGGSVVMPDGTSLSAGNYQELLQLLRRMNTIFSKPIKAEVSMLGRHGLIEAENDYARARSRGQL